MFEVESGRIGAGRTFTQKIAHLDEKTIFEIVPDDGGVTCGIILNLGVSHRELTGQECADLDTFEEEFSNGNLEAGKIVDQALFEKWSREKFLTAVQAFSAKVDAR